jgi:uncharacterized protein YciI
MHFVIYTEDCNGGLPIRHANREAHIAWLKTANASVTLLTAGPWLDDEGSMRGSLLIVDAANKAEVVAWLETDPYKIAGLPKTVTVKGFLWAIGAPQ